MRARALLPVLALLLLAAPGCGTEAGDAGDARALLLRAAQTQAKSADLKLELEAKLDGVEQLDGPVRASIQGPFRSNGPGALPDLDWRMHFEAGARQIDLRLVTVSDNAFVEYGGISYEVGPDIVARYLRQSTGQQQDIRRLGIDASRWLEEPVLEDGGRSVSGRLGVRRMLDDLNGLLARLPQGRQLPPDAIERIDDAVDDPRLELQVGADGILRSTRFAASFELPDDLRPRARGLEGGEVELRLDQTGVNGDQRIIPPSGARPLSELLGGFGLTPAMPG